MKKIYYGWVVVAAGFLLMATGWGMVYNTASLFLIPISEDMGLLRSQISFTLTLRSLVQFLVALFAGKIYQRFSITRSMKLMSLVLVASYFLLGQAKNIWQIYLLTLSGALANSFIGIVPLSVVISNWFNEKRGFALGLAFMGSGFGGMVYNNLTGRWIIDYGWRFAYRLQALVMFIIIVPVVFFMIKEKPQLMGLEAYGSLREASGEEGLSFSQVYRMPYFWLLALMSILINLAISIANISIAPHLVDIGYDFTFAANILALSMAFLAVGKLWLGDLLDKLGLRKAISLSVLGIIFSLVGLVLGQHRGALVLVVVGMGIGSAHGTMVDPYMTRELFGTRDYNTIYGVMAACASFGGILAPILHGLSFDFYGGYERILLQSLVLGLLVLVMDQWLFSKKSIDRVKAFY